MKLDRPAYLMRFSIAGIANVRSKLEDDAGRTCALCLLSVLVGAKIAVPVARDIAKWFESAE